MPSLSWSFRSSAVRRTAGRRTAGFGGRGSRGQERILKPARVRAPHDESTADSVISEGTICPLAIPRLSKARCGGRRYSQRRAAPVYLAPAGRCHPHSLLLFRRLAPGLVFVSWSRSVASFCDGLPNPYLVFCFFLILVNNTLKLFRRSVSQLCVYLLTGSRSRRTSGLWLLLALFFQ